MPETPTPTRNEPGRGRHGTQRVRIDQGSGAGSEIAPGRGSLLRAFGAWSGHPEECRAEPRHDQVECLAWIGWRTWRGFHLSNALVVNLSRGGARIFLDTPPPVRRGQGSAWVWVYLETPGQKAVVKGRVLEVRKTAGGQCTVRLVFAEPCPFAFFEAAVCGLTAVHPRMRTPRVNEQNAGSRPQMVPMNTDKIP